MEIKGKDILLLGGWGLVGTAVCRQLIQKKPNSIIIASLKQNEAEEACEELSGSAGDIKFVPEWGNIFVRTELKDLSRGDLLGDPNNRLTLAADVLEPMAISSSVEHFFLYNLIMRHNPHIIIDCVNTATGVAYQDVYSTGIRVLEAVRQAREGNIADNFVEEVEKLLGSLYLPQLIRHVQILYQAMRDADTQSYIKVGTTGTGGMGLNIPYTHSEDKPSRVLLSKSCMGGAHSLLLMLMGRTPDAPYTKEIKPAAAIAWKRITYGDILRGGSPIPMWDCPPDDAIEIGDELNVADPGQSRPTDQNLQGVFIDTGENGTFSLGEFTAITTAEQMEYVTPEEIAQTIIWELEGGNSGHDIVGALDAAILSPSYRAGVMRSLAIDKMRQLAKENNDETIAFELLGPPRLSKLLYEALLLKRVAVSIDGVLGMSAEELSRKAQEIITTDADLRSRIVSIGIPILMADGRRMLRGKDVKVPRDPRTNIHKATQENINHWSDNGWVDLRVMNMGKWLDRLKELRAQAFAIAKDDTSSQHIRNWSFWHSDQPIDEGELVGWIFIHEDEGRRIK